MSVSFLQAFAALLGWGDPALPHHAILADGFALVAALWFAFEWLRGRRRVGRGWPLVLAYALWAGLSALAHRQGGWKWLGVCELGCVWAIAASLDESERRRVVRAWMWGAAVVAVAALVVSSLSGAGIDTRWTAGGGELGWRFRAKGPAGSTGLLAELCLVPFVVAVAERRRKLAALFGAVIALSVTRTILAALVALLVLERPRAWKPLVALLGLAALASIYVDIHQLGTPGIRWRIAASAASTALHHPIFGVGPNAPPAWAAWPGPRDPVGPWDAHSTVLDLAATLGLPALLAFAALVIVALAGVAEDPLTAALQVALWATVFDAVTIDVEDFRHVWLLLGLVTAGTRALRRPPRPPSAARIPATY